MSAQLHTAAQARLADKVRDAEQELGVLNSHYADLAADAALMAGSMLPPVPTGMT